MFFFKKLLFAFRILFRERTVVIRTSDTTKFVRLYPLLQLFFLFLVCSICFFIGWKFHKFEQAQTRSFLKQYQDIIDENNEYRKYLLVVNDRLSKINEYFEVHNYISKSEKEKLTTMPSKDLELSKKVIDGKLLKTYSGLEKRNKELSKKIAKLNINAIDLVEEQVVNNDNSKAGGKGGPFEPFSRKRKHTVKPLLQMHKLKVNDKNFQSSIDKLMLAEKVSYSLPTGLQTGNGYRVTSKYGIRQDPINPDLVGFHKGLDIVVNDSNIKATKDGVVVFAGKRHGYGNCVEIEHSSDPNAYSIKTVYAHLKDVNCKKGESVKSGDNIGIQGHSGRSTGPHLHYEVIVNGNRVNPLKFINYKA